MSDETRAIEIADLAKAFVRRNGQEVGAIDHVSFSVEKGEILVLLGPSGCGKTTLLRAIAGLETPDSGLIRVGDRVLFDSRTRVDVPTHRREVGLMFQSYALWPHMTLEDNVAYPLRTRGSGKGEARKTANEYLDLVGLGGLGRQYPSELSGGQQQRAAFARALVLEPSILLLDEPLSNVDAKVRLQLRQEFLRIHRELGFTAIYVTHDQTEAMSLATRIAVIEHGRVAQLDTPYALYEHPKSRFVAEFVGAANILPATVRSSTASTVELETPLGAVLADAEQVVLGQGIPLDPGQDTTMLIRPEYVRFIEGEAANVFDGVIESAVYAGTRTEYVVRVGTTAIAVWETAADLKPSGARVRVELPQSTVRALPTGADTRIEDLAR